MRERGRCLYSGITLFLLLTSCTSPPVFQHQELVMGVFNQVTVAGEEEVKAKELLQHSFQILHAIDAQMSHYKETSEISRINQRGAQELVSVSKETFDLIQQSKEFYEKTGGAFDITVFPLVKLWGFFEGNPRLPDAEAIEEVLSVVGSDQLILDETNHRIGFQRQGMAIELGAIAKGYACDQVVEYLKREGVERALVNVGGTIRAWGSSPQGKPWTVGIRDPRDPKGMTRKIPLEDRAIATSGDYEQFFIHEGKRYSHILNPNTGYPADAFTSVSVIAPTALLADVLSTSLFVLGPEKGSVVAENFPEISLLTIPDIKEA